MAPSGSTDAAPAARRHFSPAPGAHLTRSVRGSTSSSCAGDELTRTARASSSASATISVGGSIRLMPRRGKQATIRTVAVRPPEISDIGA